jgi:hypothetical protein
MDYGMAVFWGVVEIGLRGENMFYAGDCGCDAVSEGASGAAGLAGGEGEVAWRERVGVGSPMGMGWVSVLTIGFHGSKLEGVQVQRVLAGIRRQYDCQHQVSRSIW